MPAEGIVVCRERSHKEHSIEGLSNLHPDIRIRCTVGWKNVISNLMRQALALQRSVGACDTYSSSGPSIKTIWARRIDRNYSEGPALLQVENDLVIQNVPSNFTGAM